MCVSATICQPTYVDAVERCRIEAYGTHAHLLLLLQVGPPPCVVMLLPLLATQTCAPMLLQLVQTTSAPVHCARLLLQLVQMTCAPVHEGPLRLCLEQLLQLQHLPMTSQCWASWASAGQLVLCLRHP